MERATTPWTAFRRHFKAGQQGASIVEAVIALPILLVVILGAIQFGLIYEAKATLNHASLQAARLGAVRNADPDAIRRGLARGLATLHSPDSSLMGFARTRMQLEGNLATDARIRILNPTREAFDDFGVEVEGKREIPSDRLHARSTAVGGRSGINIQDANLLKVQITYGYELQVPLVNWFIARILLGVNGGADTFEQQLLRRTRIPIIATATVRMQSPARLSDAVVSIGDFPQLDRIPSDSAPPPVSDEGEEEREEPADDDSPPSSGEEGDDGSGLDDGFFGFGGGDPAGGAGGGTGGSESGGGSGGGLNGGNPLQCSADGGGSPAPFPFDDGPPGDSSPDSSPGPRVPEPWFNMSGASSSGASIESVSIAALSVGNPIHVATGNKFQAEVDIETLPGTFGIGFRRYYNTAAVNERSVLGAGWRHSYQATLRQRGNVIEIVQADGRLLVFEAGAVGDASAQPRFVAQRANDGIVVPSAAGFRWQWRSGRELLFDAAGRLVRMREGGDDVILRYDDAGQLVAVSDPQERELRFEYYPNGRLAKMRGPGKAGAAYRYDSAGNLVQVVGADGNARRYAYQDGRHPHHLSSISVGSIRPPAYGERKPFERIATWAYDEQGRAVYSSHPNDAGKVTLAFAKDATVVTDAFGRKTRYLIGWRHGVAYVSEVRGPGCGACGRGDARYEYDERFHPLAIAIRNSQTLHYRYDDEGRLTQVERAVGESRAWLVRYGYDGTTSRITRIERPSVKPGAVAAIELEYSTQGLLERTREVGYTPDGDAYRPIARAIDLTYDARGRLRRIDGPRTDVTDWTNIEYDALGRIVAIKMQAGERKVLARDASGRPTRIAQTGRPDIKLSYDTRGRVTSVAQVRSRGTLEVSYSYDHAGRLAQIIDAQGRRIRYGFDSAGRPNRMSRSDSDVTAIARYAPDDSIERIAAFGANGQLLRTLYYAYDSERRLIEVRDGDGQPLRQLAYVDDDARPDRSTDPLGNDTWLTYDALGRLASVLAPDGGTTRVERDALGRTTSVIAPNDAHTSYVYDDFGRRVRELSADRGATTYTYDAAGNLIEKTDARGATTHLTYDAANRLIKVVRAEGVAELSYTNGLLTRVDGELVDERYEYDSDAQLVAHRRTIDGRTFTTRFTYDSQGRLATRELPSGKRLRYRYAANGALHSIVQERWRGDRVLARANEAKSAKPVKLIASGSLSFGNGIATHTTFDARSGNLSRRAIERVATLAYEHDDGGRITAIDRDGDARRYEYDAVGRLTRASRADGDGAYEYEYDANGNRASVSTPSSATRELLLRIHAPAAFVHPAHQGVGEGASRHERIAYTYAPSSNRLVSIDGNTTFAYDAAGNPLVIGTRRYEYDTNGRVIKLYDGGRLIAEYRYNFWGERVQKILHASGKRTVTTYIYEEQKLIAEADERGNITRDYVYLEHHPIAMLEGRRAYWIHTDHLGTPIAVTNEARNVVWRADYRPFGEAVVDADPDGDKRLFALNLRFPGQYADAESGTSYNYFRDYDPKTGRYLTPDPIGLGAGMNAFAYARGDPLRAVDALGLYDQMVHYYITYFLGLVAGLPQDVARTIAIAAQYVDENPLTQPIRGLASPNERALPLYHFVMDYDQRAYGDNNDNRYLRFQSPDSGQLRNLLASTDPTRLRDLWVMAHPSTFPGICPFPSSVDTNYARYHLFGEYLHAFEDTFSHRDAYNMPYAIGSNRANTPVAWLGHAGPNVPDFFGHAPDNTYNQNFRSPSRCTIGFDRTSVVVYNLSRSECDARGGRNYVAANDDDTTECEVRYVLGGTSVTRGATEAECAALGRGPGALTSTYRPGSGDIWAFNELRTLRMEYEVFASIQANFGDEIARNRGDGARTFSWSDIAGLPDWDRSNPWNNSRIGMEQGFEEWAATQGHHRSSSGVLYNPSLVLQQFNSSRLGESDRLAMLNAWLLDQGITDSNGTPVQIEEWSTVAGSGGGRRNVNIGWILADSFTGVLLPADSACHGLECR